MDKNVDTDLKLLRFFALYKGRVTQEMIDDSYAFTYMMTACFQLQMLPLGYGPETDLSQFGDECPNPTPQQRVKWMRANPRHPLCLVQQLCFSGCYTGSEHSAMWKQISRCKNLDDLEKCDLPNEECLFMRIDGVETLGWFKPEKLEWGKEISPEVGAKIMFEFRDEGQEGDYICY